MSLKRIIKKALLLNEVEEDDVVLIKTEDTTYFKINLFKMLVLFLYNFAIQFQIEKKEFYDFIMCNFDGILDVVITEIENVLFDFVNLYEYQNTEVIELNNKDETFIFLITNKNVNDKLIKMI